MHCSINMWISKRSYWYEHKTLTYLVNDKDCCKNNQDNLKVNFVVGM